MSFGDRVLVALEYRGMTREELYSVTGLKSSYLVGYIKNPRRSPTLATALKIAGALNVSLDYLAGATDALIALRGQSKSYADPRQDELNNAWDKITVEYQDSLLMTARAYAQLGGDGE